MRSELAKKLDGLMSKSAPLHLISHSRGGMVGELLYRSMMEDRDPFVAAETTRFRKARREEAERLER
ncbi:MAG: hypothetical protein R2748_10510 [Bryobacterales bacterium]